MIIGILGIGTYYCPWFPYTIASMYDLCDKIVVANNGFDLSNPKKDACNLPLPQVTKDIRRLDYACKITEITNITPDKLKKHMKLSTQAEGKSAADWFDQRGLAITAASEKANEMGATAILKIDSDQVLYDNCLELRDKEPAHMLWQYEFSGDQFHMAANAVEGSNNDAAFFYKAVPNQWFGGGGSPDIHADRYCINEYACAHLRSANPAHISDDERFNHFYGRAWFRTYTNSGLWGKELEEIATKEALGLLEKEWPEAPIKPPEATFYEDPFDYLKVNIVRKKKK